VGCFKCHHKSIGDRCRSNTEEFIKKAKSKHKGLYDYSLVSYVNNHTPVKIKCNNCLRIFNQIPNTHLSGGGCGNCVKSKVETVISDYFSKYKIYFVDQKTFPDCKYKARLRFDFYIPAANLCIEYDGEFHDETLFNKYYKRKFTRPYWLAKLRDEIKTKYCYDGRINLERISYRDKSNITSVLDKLILKYNIKKEANETKNNNDSTC